jgi:hypothetical protein
VSVDGDNSIAKPRKKKARTVRRSNSTSYGANTPRPFARGYPSWPW